MYTNMGISLKHQVDISPTKWVVFLLPNKVRSVSSYLYIYLHITIAWTTRQLLSTTITKHHCWDSCLYSFGINYMVNVKLSLETTKNCTLENMNHKIGKILAFHQTPNLAFFEWLSSLSISLLSLNLVHSSQNPFFLPSSRITFPLVLSGFKPLFFNRDKLCALKE